MFPPHRDTKNNVETLLTTGLARLARNGLPAALNTSDVGHSFKQRTSYGMLVFMGSTGRPPPEIISNMLPRLGTFFHARACFKADRGASPHLIHYCAYWSVRQGVSSRGTKSRKFEKLSVGPLASCYNMNVRLTLTCLIQQMIDWFYVLSYKRTHTCSNQMITFPRKSLNE